MEGDLIPAASALVDLAAELGIARAALAAVEGSTAISHTFTVASVDAARLSPERVSAFVREYGDTGRVEFRTGDLSELVITPGVGEDDVAAFAAGAAGGGPYELEISVDKGRLLTPIVGSTPVRECRLYFFAESLRRALMRGVRRFADEVWQHAPDPLVVAVLDTEIDLQGPHLTICGGASLSSLRSASSAAAPAVDFASLYAARDRHVGWDSGWTTPLTPWHFELSGACADPALRSLLDAQLVKLSVLFTCDRVRTEPTAVPPPIIRAEYRGQAHLAVVRIDERVPLEISGAEAHAVLAGVDWCYRRRGTNGEPDWVSDRLPFLQTRIAQTLEPRTEAERLAALARAMPYILDGIDWHWKAFVEGKVGDYLDLVKDVEGTVADTVTSFSDRAAALVKSLGEAMLAAVAVVIGTFIASAFKDPFNATLFRLGLRTYAVYVLVFPGLIGMLSSFYALRVARTTFDSRVARFKETLHPDKVESVVGHRVQKAERSYYLWLAAVAVIYIVVAAFAWCGSTTVPARVLEDAASITPTNAPSTAATPGPAAATPSQLPRDDS